MNDLTLTLWTRLCILEAWRNFWFPSKKFRLWLRLKRFFKLQVKCDLGRSDPALVCCLCLRVLVPPRKNLGMGSSLRFFFARSQKATRLGMESLCFFKCTKLRRATYWISAKSIGSGLNKEEYCSFDVELRNDDQTEGFPQNKIIKLLVVVSGTTLIHQYASRAVGTKRDRECLGTHFAHAIEGSYGNPRAQLDNWPIAVSVRPIWTLGRAQETSTYWLSCMFALYGLDRTLGVLPFISKHLPLYHKRDRITSVVSMEIVFVDSNALY